jgi:hypothetical protein
VDLRGTMELRQLEINGTDRTYLRANTTLLAQHLQVGCPAVDQAHDLGWAAANAHSAAVAPERIDYWKHVVILP